MSTLSKAFVWINLLLGVAFLAVSCVLFAQQQDWKGAYNTAVTERNTALKSAEDQNRKLAEALTQSANQVTDLNAKVSSKETEIQGIQSNVDILTKQLKGEETKYTALDGNLTQLTENMKRAQADLDNTHKLAADLEAAKKIAEKNNADAQDKVVKLTEDIADLKLNIDTLTKDINKKTKDMAAKDTMLGVYKKSFPTFVPPKDGVMPPPIDAKVEEVNAELGIVVLSVGSEDKVEHGFTFYVYRDSNYIGQVEVDKIYASKSSARINGAMSKDKIQPGDGATTRLGSF